jgi:hypothetical protein
MEYKSTIKLMPFLFLETKKATSLVLQGLSSPEIKKMAVGDNIFQVNTEKRRKEMVSILLKRINALDEFLLQKLIQGNVETGKLIVLYAIMKTDRLFFEFMNEVFREKLILKDYILENKDFGYFFIRKKEQSDKIASWSAYTFYKLKQVYIRILFEAGLIKDQKAREINKPLIDQSLIEYLKSNNEDIMIKILLGLS